MSLQLKLPLLMSVVLALVLAVTVVATYATLRSYAVWRVQDRLLRASRQIASLAAAGIATQQARYAGIVGDSALRRALRTGQMTPAARTALARAPLPTDSGLPVELWTADGRRIAVLGDDVRAALTAAPRPELPEPIASTMARPGARADSLVVTPLYSEGERSFLWYVVPVRDGRSVIGYLTHQRRIAANPQTQRTLRELSGDSVSLHWRNADARYWANVVGRPTPPFTDIDSAATSARAPDGTAVLFHEEMIPGTPLVVGLSVPERTALAAPQRSAQRLLLIGILSLVAGTLAAWVIGRRVSRPVVDVARAAEALGRGDYDVRVPETGDQEARRLAASFNTMASEISAARAALERQTREAQAANSAKSEFLTTMSHELRTPLNAIGGYVDLLDMELRGPVTDEQRRDLQRIKTSQQHLLGLISSVLDLSRIESGQLSYERVPIAVEQFLAGLDALVGPQAAAKKISLRHELRVPHLAVLADREKLRQVMINLLSNAIRHTPPGGVITMIAEPRGNRIAIEVEDTGPGIPTERRETVFEPFVQLGRSLSQTREGLGLGLAISRDLARGMGGDLTVEEGAGGGARFVVTLPIGDVAAADGAYATGETPAAR
jgi:signal transduction histidine kinase